MANSNKNNIGFWGYVGGFLMAAALLYFIAEILSSPFLPALNSIEKASVSIIGKNRFEMRVMQSESRKEFDENGVEMTGNERDSFCETKKFDQAYSYSSTSIICEFEYED